MCYYCKVCGIELLDDDEKEDGICTDCMSAMLQEDGIDMGLGIEDEII